MIRFITRLYRKPSRHSINWALDEVKRAEQLIGKPIAYRHVIRDANLVANDMARRALEGRCDVIFWGGDTPSDALTNQMPEVHEQQAPREHLDWTALPLPMDFPDAPTEHTPPTIACRFGP